MKAIRETNSTSDTNNIKDTKYIVNKKSDLLEIPTISRNITISETPMTLGIASILGIPLTL